MTGTVRRRGRRCRVPLLVLAGALMVTAVPASADPGGPEHVEVIVFVDPDGRNPGSAARSVARAHGVDVVQVYEHAQSGFLGRVPAGRLNGLRANPNVLLVGRDGPVSVADTAPLPTGIERVRAHHNPGVPTSGTHQAVDADIAVLDTGIDATHPDLHVVASVDCSRAHLDGECRSGGDTDASGHGTAVAGAAAARDNGSPAVGVAAGARLHSVQVFDDTGDGWRSNVIAGIEWVTERADEIDVANLSLAGPAGEEYDLPLARSADAGVGYVLAADNDAADIATVSPAGHDDALTVSALADFDGLPGGEAAPTCREDVDDTLADFSNYGAGQETVDVIAPGVCLTTTGAGGSYVESSGTSMAAPYVSGAAALLASNVPRPLTRDDVDTSYATIVANGSSDWDASSDPDGVQEPLLDVSAEVFAATLLDDPPPPPAPEPEAELVGLLESILRLLDL